MRPITVDDLLALPSAFMIDADIGLYANYYGPAMSQFYAQTYYCFQYNSVPNVFNYVLWGCVGFVILVAMGLRAFNHIAAGKKLPRAFITFQTFLVKHLYLSSAVGKRSMEPIGPRWANFQVPLRIHFILVFLYVLFNMLAIFCWYDILVPNMYYQDFGYPLDQIMRGFSDRTGVISFGATPLVILLSGRNSPVAFMTGASYSTIQIYHRWVARVTFFHALAHGIGYTLQEWIYSVPGGTNWLTESFKEAYWNWGCVAVGGGALLAFFSHRRLRELCYEAFLIGHIVGAILWIVGCYYHVYLLDPKYVFLKWIYASIGLWVFDRFARGVRMWYLNTPSLLKSRSTSSGAIATRRSGLAAEGYLAGSGDFIRLRLTLATPWPASMGGPGTYVFVSCPSLNIWESHPFTISYPLAMPSPSTSISTPATHDDDPSKDGSFMSSSYDNWTHAEDNASSFELILKSYSGFTRKLARALHSDDTEKAKGSGSLRTVKLIVDGPYGTSTDLSKYDSVLLVSGGSGVSATVAHLADLAKHAEKGTLRTKRIVVAWAIRDEATIDVLAPYIRRLSGLLPTDILSLHIYYTGLSSLPLFPELKSLCASVMTHHGRPVVSMHVDEFKPESGESVAVSACGPPGLCDATREVIKSRMGRDGWDTSNLTYHDEVFTW